MLSIILKAEYVIYLFFIRICIIIDLDLMD